MGSIIGAIYKKDTRIEIIPPVYYDCLKDKISLNKTMPLNQMFKQEFDDIPRLVIRGTKGKVKNFDTNLKSRFQQLAPSQACPLNFFTIDKVLNKDTGILMHSS